jgi:hypothetical protein
MVEETEDRRNRRNRPRSATGTAGLKRWWLKPPEM